MDVLAAGFVGNNAWFGVLLTIHVLAAVIGLGPTFAFGIMGPLAGKVGQESPPAGLGILIAMETIAGRLVEPILLTVTPISGAMLIWNRGLNHDFFSKQRLWLIVSMAVYLSAVLLANLVQNPALKKMIGLAKGGQGGSPEFGALAARTAKVGPVLGIFALTMIVLMVWKPGSGCVYQC